MHKTNIWYEYGRRLEFLSYISGKANRWEVVNFLIKYADDLVKGFRLDSKKNTKTPMSISVKLGQDPIEKVLIKHCIEIC